MRAWIRPVMNTIIKSEIRLSSILMLKALEGKSVWGKPCDVQQHEVRGSLSQKAFDGKGMLPLRFRIIRLLLTVFM